MNKFSGGISSMRDFISLVRYEIANKVKMNQIFVLGNESCDLDSVCCSLSYAYFRQKKASTDQVFIPICCLNKEDMPLRTEVTYWLKKNNIDWHFLIYLDTPGILDFDNSRIKSSLILVDHFKPIEEFKDIPLIEIIDHHHIPESYPLPKLEFFQHMLTGSCSTLIAKNIIAHLNETKASKDQYLEALMILYGAILTDTVGLSDLGRSYGKVTEEDIQTAEKLENLLECSSQRSIIYEECQEAKNNIAGLTVLELLRRDMKIAIPDNKKIKLTASTISGVDLESFICKRDFKLSADTLCATNGSPYLVCITAASPKKVTQESDLIRGLIIYSAHSKLYPLSKIVNELMDEKHSLNIETKTFELEWNPGKADVFIGRVGNMKFSRKILMPILIKTLSNFKLPVVDASQKNMNMILQYNSKSSTIGPRLIDWISMLNDAQIILLFSNPVISKKTLAQVKENFKCHLLMDQYMKGKRTNIQAGIRKGWHSSSKLIQNQFLPKQSWRKNSFSISHNLEPNEKKCLRKKNYSTSDKDAMESISSHSLNKMSPGDFYNYGFINQHELAMMEALGGSQFLRNDSIAQLILDSTNPNDLAEANSFNLLKHFRRSRRNTTGGFLMDELNDVDEDSSMLKLESLKSNSFKRSSQLTDSEYQMLKMTKERCCPKTFLIDKA